MAKRPNKLHIKKGDTVIVLRGKDAPTRDKSGKVIYTKGRVLKVYPAERRALVEGVNMVKKHSRPSQTIRKGASSSRRLRSISPT